MLIVAGGGSMTIGVFFDPEFFDVCDGSRIFGACLTILGVCCASALSDVSDSSSIFVACVELNSDGANGTSCLYGARERR